MLHRLARRTSETRTASASRTVLAHVRHGHLGGDFDAHRGVYLRPAAALDRALFQYSASFTTAGRAWANVGSVGEMDGDRGVQLLDRMRHLGRGGPRLVGSADEVEIQGARVEHPGDAAAVGWSS